MARCGAHACNDNLVPIKGPRPASAAQQIKLAGLMRSLLNNGAGKGEKCLIHSTLRKMGILTVGRLAQRRSTLKESEHWEKASGLGFCLVGHGGSRLKSQPLGADEGGLQGARGQSGVVVSNRAARAYININNGEGKGRLPPKYKSTSGIII